MSGALQAPGNPVVHDQGVLDLQPANATAPYGDTVDLVTSAENPAGLLLWSASISSGAAGDPAAPWQATDSIQDTDGNVYLQCQLAQQNTGGQVVNSIEQDMKGITIPVGVGLVLVNGGAGTNDVLRQCVATIIFSQLMAGPG
jgi:hypothetical protein